jgi:hypothetical protein
MIACSIGSCHTHTGNKYSTTSSHFSSFCVVNCAAAKLLDIGNLLEKEQEGEDSATVDTEETSESYKDRLLQAEHMLQKENERKK